MKRTKIIALVLVLLLAVLSLSACDALLSQKNDSPTRTEKIDFAQAAENYEKEPVKKSDVNVRLKGTVYINKQNVLTSGLKEQYNIGSTIRVVRTQENDKLFLTSELTASDTDNAIGSLIGTISPKTAYLQHYLNGSVELEAKLGIQNGTYNLKAQYNDHEAEESGSIWFVADDESLSTWLDNNAPFDFTKNRLNTYLMKTVFSQLDTNSIFFGKDDANKFVDKNGHSLYDISLKKADDLIYYFLTSGLLDFLGVKDKSVVLEDYSDFFNDVKNWFTVTPKNITADVNNNLPQKISTGFVVDLNINTESIRNIIYKLNENGVIDNASTNDSLATFNFIANNFLCGTEGQDDAIGLSLDIDFEEKFSYNAAACKLSDNAHKDFFISPDEDVEGRHNLVDYIKDMMQNKNQTSNDEAANNGAKTSIKDTLRMWIGS